jgi:phosphatidylinositol alpha-1,6-mannosyltransferase
MSAAAPDRIAGKVLLIASNFPPVRGGSAVVYDNMAREAGARVDVLAPQLSYLDGTYQIGWREHDRRASYRVRRLPLLRTIMPDAAPTGWHRLRLMADDLWIRLRLLGTVAAMTRRQHYKAICLGELLASGWMIRILRLLLRVRVIIYVHGEEITTRDGYDPEKRRCRKFLQAASGIVVVSRFTQAAVLGLLGPQAAGRVRLIENGVASRRFTAGAKRADLVTRYGLEGRFVFVSVCRLLEKKGVDHALRAFAALSHEAPPDAPGDRFLVVGGGPFEPDLKALAERLGIAEQVVFAGQVADEDLVDMYRLGDVFVMPNRELPNGDTEGFGLVFLEANACGLPVLAGCDGGSPDAVQDGQNGLVVNGKSVAEITAALRRLRHDTALRKRLRCRGLEMARQADWAQRTSTFLAFCTEPDPA